MSGGPLDYLLKTSGHGLDGLDAFASAACRQHGKESRDVRAEQETKDRQCGTANKVAVMPRFEKMSLRVRPRSPSFCQRLDCVLVTPGFR